MTNIDGFIDDFLQHDYDPEKRRQYYLRTRKLKGRGPKTTNEPTRKSVASPLESKKQINSARDQARRKKAREQQARLNEARKKAEKKAKGSLTGKLKAKFDDAQKKIDKVLREVGDTERKTSIIGSDGKGGIKVLSTHTETVDRFRKRKPTKIPRNL